MAIQNIAVLGAGQMGNGITQVAAAAGYNVTMIDIQQEYVDKGLATIERSLGKLGSKRTHVPRRCRCDSRTNLTFNRPC